MAPLASPTTRIFWRFEEVKIDENWYLEANPDPEQNAGFGWHMGWGKVYHPDHAYNPTDQYMLMDQNGGRHVFYDQLHPRGENDGDSDVYYTPRQPATSA